MCCGFGGRPGPRLAWLSYLAARVLAEPPRQRVWGDERAELPKRGVGEEPCFQGKPAALSVGEAQPLSAEHLPQRSNLLLLVRDDRFLLAMDPAGQHRRDRVGGSIPEVQCHASHTTLDWEIRRVERDELGSWNR